MIPKAFTCIFNEDIRCSENNGGCEDRCEDNSKTGHVVCSCSIPGMRLSTNMKSCMGKEEKKNYETKKKEHLPTIVSLFDAA